MLMLPLTAEERTMWALVATGVEEEESGMTEGEEFFVSPQEASVREQIRERERRDAERIFFLLINYNSFSCFLTL